MRTISQAIAKAHLAEEIDYVCRHHEPLLIKREMGGSVVILSLENYKSWGEMNHLTRSLANTKRLIDAVISLNGKTQRTIGDE